MANERYNSLGTLFVPVQTPDSRRTALLGHSAGAQERDARPGDGPPETAPNCEALTPKAKATAGEPIRTPVHVWRGVSAQE